MEIPIGNPIWGRKMAKINVSLEIVNFQQEMQRVEEEVRQMADMEISEKITYAVDTLKVVTPVDTGRARSGWTSQRFRSSKKLKEEVQEGIISNPVEYVEYLNRGTSNQAPRYFIEQVLTRIGLVTPE